MIPGDANRKDGRLVEELGIHVVSTKRRLGACSAESSRLIRGPRARTATSIPVTASATASASARLRYLTRPNGRRISLSRSVSLRSVSTNCLSCFTFSISATSASMTRALTLMPRPRATTSTVLANSSGIRTVVALLRHAIMIASHQVDRQRIRGPADGSCANERKAAEVNGYRRTPKWGFTWVSFVSPGTGNHREWIHTAEVGGSSPQRPLFPSWSEPPCRWRP